MIRIKNWNEEREDLDVGYLQHKPERTRHLYEEQWRKIKKGSKRQATLVRSPTMSGLRYPDTPHAQNTAQRSTRLDRLQTKEYPVDPWMTYVCYTSNKPRSYFPKNKVLHKKYSFEEAICRIFIEES